MPLSVTAMPNFSRPRIESKNPIYQDVMDGIVSPGNRVLFALVLQRVKPCKAKVQILIPYLPKNGIVITDKALDEVSGQFWQVRGAPL